MKGDKMRDEHEGQRVSRRNMLAGVSSLGLGGLLAACTTNTPATTSTGETVSPQASTSADLTGLFADAGTCTLMPSTTQGPYYFDADKIRSNVREDKQGAQLRLAMKLQDSETCRPLGNAVVEIWHCDAAGLYSGAESQSSAAGRPGGTPPVGGPSPSRPFRGDANAPFPDLTPTDDKRYLRGAQVTNADGIVEFTTIWPGWYAGRTVHIHVMVHVSNERVLTTQLMFDEALNATVLSQQPYSQHTGRDTFNDNDYIYQPTMLLKITKQDSGYLGAMILSADSDKDGK
jgi:protocatechuate 3,4-dioxygenase beta subunit